MLQSLKALTVEDVWVRVAMWTLVIVFTVVLLGWIWRLPAGE
jgi:hypothetical protein